MCLTKTIPGFGLRIRAGDKGQHRTFIAQYKIGAKHRRITLGNVTKVTLENARQQAKRIFGKVANGDDPANEKAEKRRVASHTLDATIANYLEAKAIELKPRSFLEVKRHLERDWQALHSLAIANIGRANVAAALSVMAKTKGGVTANRSRAALSALYRWAIGEGLCDQNPVTGTNRQEENGHRERSLSDSEVAKVWRAAPENDHGKIVRLLMLTGCRRNEIGGLKWSEVSLETRTLTIAKERTKNGMEHIVPLSDAALRSFRAPCGAVSEILFSALRETAGFPDGRSPRLRSIRRSRSKTSGGYMTCAVQCEQGSANSAFSRMSRKPSSTTCRRNSFALMTVTPTRRRKRLRSICGQRTSRSRSRRQRGQT